MQALLSVANSTNRISDLSNGTAGERAKSSSREGSLDPFPAKAKQGK